MTNQVSARLLSDIRETFGGWRSVDAWRSSGNRDELVVELRADIRSVQSGYVEPLLPRKVVTRTPNGIRFHGRIVGRGSR